LVLTACGGSSPSAPLPDGPAEVDNGGTLLLPACGYSVTTPMGAEAPVVVPSASAPLGADPTPRQIHLGLAGDPVHTMAVLWRTADETTTATTVRYGTQSVTENSVDGLSFRYVTGFGSDGPRVRMHETHLCGLAPDTTYRYQVGGKGSDGRESWSVEHSFRTAPDVAADPSAQVTALVIGDTRGIYLNWGPLLAAADQAASPDLVLFTGDLVFLSNVQSEWDGFFDAAEPVLARVPFLTAKGNHEFDSTAYACMNALPGDEHDFGLDYGPFHLTVLDDTPDDDSTIAGAKRAFLAADVAAHAAAPWRLLLHHQPMFSSAQNHGSNLELRAAWEPVVDAQGIDLVLSGHDHDYERSKPLRAGQVTSGGAIYVVSGGAGNDLYTNGSSDFTQASEKTQNYVVLTVRKGQLDARAFRDNGTLLDSFTLIK
jgi:3',5'-cyclic AMP phosphodiesterase CpdA